jgi:hypothetical protein
VGCIQHVAQFIDAASGALAWLKYDGEQIETADTQFSQGPGVCKAILVHCQGIRLSDIRLFLGGLPDTQVCQRSLADKCDRGQSEAVPEIVNDTVP